MKKCNKCLIKKSINKFQSFESRGKIYTRNFCIMCKREYDKVNKKEYSIKNKDLIKDRNKLYYQKNRTYVRNYQKNYLKELHGKDIFYVLRKNVSRQVNRILKTNGGSKFGKSILKYLPYTIQDLKNHLELKFEPWMTWDNYGKYNFTLWNDCDQSTWTWNIDHIIPQSKLPYTSMEVDNFKKCWDLDNLRPLSAKYNYLDGINRTRHRVNKW